MSDAEEQTESTGTPADQEELISPGCSLFFTWILLNTLGLGIGWALGWWLSFRLPGAIASLTIGAVCGLVLGLFQWILLPVEGKRQLGWIPLSGLTWGIGFAAGSYVSAALGLTGALFGILLGALLGLNVGTGQWLLMRRSSRRAFWWVPASTFSLAAAFMLYNPGLSVWGLFYGVLYGFVTSIAVLFITYTE